MQLESKRHDKVKSRTREQASKPRSKHRARTALHFHTSIAAIFLHSIIEQSSYTRSDAPRSSINAFA
ncbi:hypothetical protein BST61_g9470 [Cercospora zeina]